MIGILIGAGIFQVTSQAWALTGPSVILGYALLTPAILATSIPYAAYLSTPLGSRTGRRISAHLANTQRFSTRVRRLVAEDHFLHRRRCLSRQRAGRIPDCFRAAIASTRNDFSLPLALANARPVLRDSRHRHTLVRTHAGHHVGVEVSGAASF